MRAGLRRYAVASGLGRRCIATPRRPPHDDGPPCPQIGRWRHPGQLPHSTPPIECHMLVTARVADSPTRGGDTPSDLRRVVEGGHPNPAHQFLISKPTESGINGAGVGKKISEKFGAREVKRLPGLIVGCFLSGKVEAAPMKMYEYCERLRFVTDMNRDGAFTISDVWLLVKTGWLLPSNFWMIALHDIDKTVATFFEIDCSTGQGVGGALFSLLIWGGIVGQLAEWVISFKERWANRSHS